MNQNQKHAADLSLLLAGIFLGVLIMVIAGIGNTVVYKFSDMSEGYNICAVNKGLIKIEVTAESNLGEDPVRSIRVECGNGTEYTYKPKSAQDRDSAILRAHFQSKEAIAKFNNNWTAAARKKREMTEGVNK